MRVTDSLMSQNFLRNLGINTKNVQKYQTQLSTLKQVSKSSDDPLRVSKILDLKSSITQNEQYKNTISTSIDFTNVQDSALDSATQALQRIKTLTQSSASDTLSDEGRQANKAEIEEEINNYVNALNTKFGNQYLFAGKNTSEAPFEVENDANGEFLGIKYNGTTDPADKGNLTREIAAGVTIELSTDGRAYLNEQTPGDNIGTFFKDVLTALDKNDTKTLSGLLTRADNEIDNVVNNRSKIGAIFNSLEATKDRNESEKLNLDSTLSENQDIDLAETYTQYMMEMTAYQSSMMMGTKILQTSILDYL
ncbi:flagellar hook-associated protein FlgL [Carnobacterium mobile]|uniref:flagellar hook-associated protein FlgL n=1 Tax=Carnobacterium mobile TaxID=2750 RepID=UPI0018660287|nr:flagellar hook-associated protein FlgL [Carnobacterium mobile]